MSASTACTGATPGKTKLVGDVDFRKPPQVAGAITPVPGGVGPMTIACLMLNTCARPVRSTDCLRRALTA